jgi:regulator of RNase E activity RraB
MKVDINAEINGHVQRNKALRDSLREKGVELDEMRSVELHFWAFSKQTAVMLAKALYDHGLLVLALSPVDGEESQWTVDAGTKDTVENLSSLPVVKKFVELAAEFDSTYDGWGTTV